MAYEGGYTSALNSESVRALAQIEAQQRQQQMREQAIAFQQQQDAVRRRLLARQRLGGMMGELGALGDPNAGGGPQPPMPGQPSVPMLPPPPQGGMPPPPMNGMPPPQGGGMPQPPQGMPPGGGMPMPPPAAASAPPGTGPAPMAKAAGPGAPPAAAPGGAPAGAAPAPPPQGWQQLPKPPEAAGGAPNGLPPPPGDGAVMPRKLVSVADMAKLLKAKGIEGEGALDMLEEWKPYMDDENKRQFDSMKIAYQAQNAAMKVYESTVRTLTAQQRAAEQGRHNRTEEGIQRDRNAAIRSGATARAGGGKPTWTKSTIDYYAERALAGDNTWRTGLSRTAQGASNIAAVDDRVAEMSAERGSTPTADVSNRAVRAATEKALTERTKYVATGQQFVRNFQKQADLVEKYLGTGAAGSTPIINKWIQKGRKAVEGDPDVTAFDTAIRGLAREHQRIVTGVTSNAQLHVSAQETADELLNRDMTPDQVRATLKVMREEATNAVESGQEEVGALKTELKSIGAAPAKGDAPPTGIPTGSKAIGWSKDSPPKRVWQSPDGKKWTE